MEGSESRQSLAAEIVKITAAMVSPEQIEATLNYLDDCEIIEFKDERQVASVRQAWL